MSLNNVIAFGLLLRKMTRKGSIGKKNFQYRKQKKANKTSTNPTTTPTHQLSSSCSSSDDEEEEESEEDLNQEIQHIYHEELNSRDSFMVSTHSIKSLQPSQVKVVLKTPILTNSKSIQDLQNISRISLSPPKQDVKIRDFAYPVDSNLHFGKKEELIHHGSTMSLSSPDFNGRDARALFDFSAETEYEISLKAGQIVWVQYRQCPGWLIADVQDETGLIPESYVEFI